MADKTIDAVALAAESTPQAFEPAVRTCAEDGCGSIVTRSDGRCTKHSKYALMVAGADITAEVNERLRGMGPELVALIPATARAAAERGDIKAIAWALTHGKHVEPVAPQHQGPTGGGQVIVQVGIILPGLPGADE